MDDVTLRARVPRPPLVFARARAPRTRPTSTASSRSRSPSAIGSRIAGRRRRRRIPGPTPSASTTCPPSSSSVARSPTTCTRSASTTSRRSSSSGAGLELADILEDEPEPGLGNGGLGRLAACFLDSMATLGYAGYGYGIRYEFGIFEQEIKNGWQVERPDEWLRFGNPWEFVRPEYAVNVSFGGRVEAVTSEAGDLSARWVDTHKVLGVPFDTPIAGFRNDTVNTLRLWQARAGNEFDLKVFNDGDYVRAVEDKNSSEVISKVLYPNDSQPGRARSPAQAGVLLRRLRDRGHRSPLQEDAQELRRLREEERDPAQRHAPGDRDRRADARARRPRAACRGTAPGRSPSRPAATRTTRSSPRRSSAGRSRCSSGSCRGTSRSSTRSTAASCARSWRASPVTTRASGACRSSKRAPRRGGDGAPRRRRLARGQRRRGAPHRSPQARRAPRLRGDDAGEVLQQDERRHAAPLALALQPAPLRAHHRGHRPGVGHRSRSAREARASSPTTRRSSSGSAPSSAQNKADFAQYAADTWKFRFDPDSMFDVQIKRLHEYKRQLLNALHVVRLYLDAKRDPKALDAPRTVLFGAKAAPGYRSAKLIIKLINGIADVVNSDVDLQGRLRVAFLPNYRVSLAERIIPAADLSEQISTAGKEASGTGQHEALDERRAHHRHARRRQRRDPRGGRRGQLLPLRPHDARGARPPAHRLPSARRLRPQRAAARGDRPRGERLLQQRRSDAVPAADRLTSSITTRT